ncbi:HdeA/HdeB family chaperone [uncultured Thiodictyon sp.]|uniref:HdeA/HdeB family chaperone n=1 Tax=uncultured Thiodictyon sp. TaxID=1846217 RepID=UPI0025E49807|nr:HdeA/HdeB family chaperone [uncultured Thiodictyon sp.]
MHKPLVLMAAAALFCAPLATMAKDYDLAKMTCAEFLDDKDTTAMMIFWIDGYMSAESKDTTISDEWMKKLGTHMGEFCGEHPKKSIMDAIDAMPAEE